jgi:hypothetical protein
MQKISGFHQYKNNNILIVTNTSLFQFFLSLNINKNHNK